MNCNEYEDFRELTPLEQCMANHNLSEDDVIEILKAYDDGYVRKSNFYYEIQDNSVYIQTIKGYKFETIEIKEGYLTIKAVKVEEND